MIPIFGLKDWLDNLPPDALIAVSADGRTLIAFASDGEPLGATLEIGHNPPAARARRPVCPPRKPRRGAGMTFANRLNLKFPRP